MSDSFVLIAVLALTAALIVVAPAPAAAGVPVVSCTGTTTITCTFSTVGAHSFTVPAGVTSLTIVASGGGGGGSGSTGGSGTRVTATRTVTANQVIAISVAGGGTGGGAGSGGGGGGATRIDTSVIVAGGGGGSGSRTGGGAGGSLAGGGNGLAGSVGTVGTSAGGGGVLGVGGVGGAGGSGSSPCAGFSSGTCAGDSGTGTAGGAGGGDSTNLAGGFGGGGLGGYGGVYQPYPPQVLTGAGGGGGGGGYGGGGGGGAGSVADGSASGGGGGVGGSTGPAGSTYGSAGNGGAAASSGGAGSVTITYTKASQTITFGVLGGKTFGDADFDVSATATSGATVAFTTTTTDFCTVTAGGTVSIEGAGDCTIDADQAGTDGYTAAPRVSRTFTVAPADQTITFGALGGKTFGDADFDVSASASSNLGVAFTALTIGVCTVLGDTVAIVGAGLCVIGAEQAGDDDWNEAPQVSQSFTVDKADQTITFDVLGDKVFGDADFSLLASASSSLPVGFTTTSTDVCTVTGSAVSIVGTGICDIRSSQDGDDDWNAAAAVDQSFTVAKADQTIDYATPVGLVFGDDPRTILATADSGLPVVLSTGTPTVCTVSGDTVTIVGAGSCVIDADQAGDDDWNAASRVSRNLVVGKADQMIDFTTPSGSVFGDGPRTLVATSGSGLPVVLSTGTPTVCSVSGATVSIVGAGSCVIDADQAGDDDWNAAPRVSRNLTVGKAGQSISFAALGDRAFGDGSFQVSASATSGGAVTFASGTPVVCSVAAQTVNLLAAGDCIVEARQAGGPTHLAAPVVTRGFTVEAASQRISFGPATDTVFGGPSFFIGASASSGLPVTLASATPTVCTVDGSEVTIVGAGTCTIVAGQTGDDRYAPAAANSVTLQIAPVDASIEFDTVADMVVGGPSFELEATASSGLPVSFSSQTPEVCTVDGATVTVLAAGTCTITAVQEGDTDHAATFTEITFGVGAAAQTVTPGDPAGTGGGGSMLFIVLLLLLAVVGGTIFVLRMRS